MKATKIQNINDILNSQEFNLMFDFENEQKEIEQAGWTIQECVSFAEQLSKKIEKK
jgi:hypothetical protein